MNSWVSGDFDPSNTKPCIVGAQSYTGYLLLSIESITTTGYGYVYPTDQCQMAWFVLTLNTLVVIVIDGAFFTVVYVKISKPINRDLVKFSRRAVVSAQLVRSWSSFVLGLELVQSLGAPFKKLIILNICSYL